MDATNQIPTSSHGENVLNILVFQQDGSNVPMLEENLSMSHDMQVPDSQRALTLAASPALSDGSLGSSLSNCPSQDEDSSYSWFQRAAKASSTPRPSLYKSQSFTVGQCEVESQYPHLDDLRNMSKFSNISLNWKRNILSNPMETNSEHLCPSQLNLKADSTLLKGRVNKRSKHKSHSNPVGVSGVNAVPPDLLMANLGQSSIHSLTATPDSGFSTPGSSITEEPLSAASLVLSTPKLLKFQVKSQHADVESSNALNKVLVEEPASVDQEDESVLDRSLNSVNWLQNFTVGNPVKPLVAAAHWTAKPVAGDSGLDQPQVAKSEPSAITNVLSAALPPVAPLINITSVASGSQQILSTPLPQFNITPMVCSKQTMSTPLPQLNITHRQTTSTPLPQLNLTPKQTVSATLPLLSITPISKVPFIHQRNILQELNSNICYNPVTKTQPPKPIYERPSYSYMDLIKMALKESKDGQSTLKEIMAWIEDHFPFFKYKAKQSWKSSVRCNLSLHQDFVKVDGKKRGGKWKVAEGARSHLHRLPKPPVMKQPTASKVPAVTRLKSCRSGPLPILPKSVPYALVPLGLTALEQNNKTQNIHDQAMQILQQQQRSPVLQALQVQQIFHNQQPQTHVITSQHPLTSASSANPHQTKASLQQMFHNQQAQTRVITSQHPIASASSANSHQPKDSLQQIFHQTHVITSQQPLTFTSSANSQLTKGSFQRIAPKLNVNPTTLVLDSKSFIMSSYKDGGQADKAHLEFQSVNVKGCTDQRPGVDTSSLNVTTLDIGKQGHVSRPSISDSILKPVDTQIQQGNLSNEKKIVFILKQPQGQEKQINKVPAVMPTDYNIHCLIRDNQLPKHTPALVPLKARSICKTVDQIQRSKSDGWNESTCVKPYSKGKSGNSSRKAPIVNLEHLLKEGKQDEKDAAKIFFMDDDDCDSDFIGKLPSNFCDSSKKSVAPRPDSAPAMCLIQQAWEKANLMFDSDDIDCLLLDSHSSGDHVDRQNMEESSRLIKISENVIPSIVSSESMQTIHKEKNGKFKIVAKKCGMKENHLPIPVIAEKTVSARRIIFHSAPNSQGFISFSSSSGSNSSIRNSLCKQEAVPQATTTCPPLLTLNRMKSRRKQIHTPLSTDTDSSEDKGTACLYSTSVRNHHVKTSSSVDSTCVNSAQAHLFQTPPVGTQHTVQDTSSPNSENPSPLDFAAFLSILSTSPRSKLNVDSALPSGQADHFLDLLTPSIGTRPVPSASAFGMQLSQENQEALTNPSSVLDSSLFDTLDSFL